MKGSGIEDIYELTPLQQGMLYHSVEARGAALYMVTVLYELHGRIDVMAFRGAWEKLIEHHPLLRTSFHWEEMEEPHQVVHERVNLPFAFEDWRHLSAEEKAEALEDFLEEEKTQECELSKAPLLRISLIHWETEHYKFVLCHHHILLDGWCRPLIFDQLLANYQALVNGKQVVPPSPRPYRDYVLLIDAQDLSDAERFWRNELSGFSASTSLGMDRPLDFPQSEQYRIATRNIRLSREKTSALRAFSRENRVTMNTLIQGAWALLLSRYSGDEDVVFGAISAARPPELEGIEDTVGLFINTLPVRVHLAGDVRVVGWLQELQSRQAAARQFSHTPLAKIHRWSDVSPGLPLFESILVFLNLPPGEERRSEAGFEMRFVEHLTRTNFPLYLEVRPESEMSLTLIYDRARIADDTAERMLDHCRALLDEMVRGAHLQLRDLSMMSESELQQVVYAWNDTTVSHPPVQCVHELIEAQVERTPDATAVVDADGELSYKELNQNANRLANYLRATGVSRVTPVGVCMHRTVDLAVALLAILKAGSSYVPMDPDYPRDRLEFMKEDAGISTLVTHRELDASLDAENLALVRFDEDRTAIANHSDDNPVTTCVPADLAYVIYTSGSTGNPKGVMVPHSTVVNLLQFIVRELSLTPEDRLLAVTSLSFDIAVLELFAPLIVGARVLIAHRDLVLDPRRLLAWSDVQNATVLQATPVMWQLLLDSDWKTPREMTALCGGEPLDRSLARQLLAGIHGRVFNMYGPTETTVWSTMHEIRSAIASPPIGRPIANTQAYVLDRRLNPVPPGVAGELYLGGSGIVRGYLNRPGLTAERFIPDPFSKQPGARMYATGDIVRHMRDGALEFRGRADQQIKLRGMRIELEEIESCLDRHPGVDDSVVLLKSSVHEESHLVGYIVPAAKTEKLRGPLAADFSSEVREYLQRKLPASMVPTAFVLLDEMPLTPNRKIDRNRLPEPDNARRPRTADQEPHSPLESTIAEIWKHVLRVDDVSTLDNFFDLGGSSLLAMRAAAQIEERTSVRLSPREFVFQNLSQIAGMIQSRQHSEHAA